MKKCPYCGKEYTDDVVRCLIDDELLLGGEQPSLPDGAGIVVSQSLLCLSTSESAAQAPSTPLTDRQLHIFEVGLVCVVAFGGYVLSSGHSLFSGDSGVASSGSPGPRIYAWVYNALHEASALGLLWYVLIRRGKSFSNLGLFWEWKDIGRSIALWVGGSLAFSAVYYSIHFAGLTTAGLHTSRIDVGRILFGGGVSFAAILFQFLNPFFEELIVRAYVITEIKLLTNSMSKAILVSTILQTSYHFYQGAPVAFALGPTFLIFSIYYAKTNRIAPIILAHLYSDVGNTLWYLFRQ